MTDLRHLRTSRMVLDAASPADVEQLHPLMADPAAWTHYPSGRHTGVEQTTEQLARFAAAWEQDGLGYWIARSPGSGELLGVGGCMLKNGLAWNVYYRLAPAAQGRGYAGELVTAARDAADAVRPELPVMAYLLEHNEASRQVAERAGFELVWRGPDGGNPDRAAVRLVFADRRVPPEVLAALTC